MSSLHLLDSDNYEMCGRCSGTGKDYCSSCGGSGGHNETRYDYDYDGRSISRSEWARCTSCSGTGFRRCSLCGGTGSARKYSHRKRRQHDLDTEGVAEEDISDEEDAAEREKPLSHAELVASYHEAMAEARQVQQQLLEETWDSTSIADAVKPEMCNWIRSLDPESSDTSKVVDDWISQWESYFPAYDRFLLLLRTFSSASFRTNTYKWLSENQ
jgi:hypothetical protein